MICNLGVVSSNLTIGSRFVLDFLVESCTHRGGYSSGQRGRTVNPLGNLRRFESCSPHYRGSSSAGRASAFQAEGRGFESRLPL
uniref:Uncharacterized protein n=1 Tax=uncultured Sphingobacterium sp. EB080_L08E11 TaxID=710992 RepID=E0Y0J7_9SPHI|nr:hypothetical protein [uncultured Sphingobacterium sp. EB080_L08E11]